MPIVLPIINGKYVEDNQDEWVQRASETFFPSTDYFNGAGFVDAGPTLAAYVENADDYVLDQWYSYDIGDVYEKILDHAKHHFEEHNVWNAQINSDNVDEYNEAEGNLISDIEWTMGEYLYEYLKRKYPEFDDTDQRLRDLYNGPHYNRVNSKPGWRAEYIKSSQFNLTADGNGQWCDPCDNYTPHWVHVNDNELIKTGGRILVCAACGDGS